MFSFPSFVSQLCASRSIIHGGLALLALALAFGLAPGLAAQTTSPDGVSLDRPDIIAGMYRLIVTVTPAGSGTVAVEPAKTAYNHQEKVLLSAKPAAGHVFAGWTEVFQAVPMTSDPATNIALPPVHTANPLTLVMTRNVILVARFVRGEPGPRLEALGRGLVIASGDTTPALNDDTDFGVVSVRGGDATVLVPDSTQTNSNFSTTTGLVAGDPNTAGGVASPANVLRTSVLHAFLLRNSGTETVNLTGTPLVAVRGPHAAEFVVAPPAVKELAPGRMVPFAITFTPRGTGLRTASVVITTNDASRSPYTFAVQGTGGAVVLPYLPKPEQVNVTPSMAGGEFRANLAIQVNTGGYRAEWGRAVRQGNVITLEPQIVAPTGPAIQVISTLSFSYSLGALPAGEYTLVVKTGGHTLKSRAFTVCTLTTVVDPAGSGHTELHPQPVGTGHYLAGTTVTLKAVGTSGILPWPMPMDGTVNATTTTTVTGTTSTTTTTNPNLDPTIGVIVRPGTVFRNWSGDLSGTANPATLSLTASRRVVAHFGAPQVTPVAPVVVSSPPSRTVRPGGSTTLAAVVQGTEPITYSWKKDGVAVAGASRPSLTLASVAATDAGAYVLAVSNSAGSAASTAAEVAVVDAQHRLVGTVPAAGGTIEVSNTLTYAGAPVALAWQVILPDGWSYASGSGAEGDIKPAPGTTGMAEWAWTTVPASPVMFNYTLNVPPGASGDKAIRALVVFRQSSGPSSVLVRPDPLLTPETASHHTADTNRDLRISLVELTRVIELYNVRHGTQRTGGYAVATTATEDGFAPSPAAPALAAGETAALARFYSADTDRDGRLSLTELTRVIELYNARNGSVRTGQYRALSGSEDGFGPGS